MTKIVKRGQSSIYQMHFAVSQCVDHMSVSAASIFMNYSSNSVGSYILRWHFEWLQKGLLLCTTGSHFYFKVEITEKLALVL